MVNASKPSGLRWRTNRSVFTVFLLEAYFRVVLWKILEEKFLQSYLVSWSLG